MRSFLRGAVEVHILHHPAECEVLGAWLAAELARHGHAIGSGTLYPMLHRMHQAGLLDRHERVAAGRRLRRYTATPAGREALTAARVALRELAAEILAGPPLSSRTGPAGTGADS